MWLSLLTAALCVVGMFLISWPVALITIGVVLFFYLVVLYRKPGEATTTTFYFNYPTINNYYRALLSFETLIAFALRKL